MSLLLRFSFVASAILLATVVPARANPANKAAIEKHFGALMADRAQTCVLCHVADHGDAASSLEEFPHNVFGDAVRAAGERLLDEGKDDAISDRMQLIANDDSDGDGTSNLLEILLGSKPGDPDDVPGEDALARKPEVLAAYDAKVNQYAWRPFEPVQRPPVPSVEMDWGHNAIDAFIAGKHRQLQLMPQPEATPEQLLRRVYLDLIGLSPTPEAIRSFAAEYEHDPSAYDRVVTELLEHPGYGERWGRHWMDVWRYSDWSGYKDALRESQRHIWHWRDWIVESLNADTGYDQMVMQMLAADEMQSDEADLRATGFLARNYFTNRDQWMDNVVKHTSQALMGVTLGCAKCHDHMTDPLEQTEYYGLRAVFEPYHVQTDRVPGELDINQNGIPRVYDRTTNAKTYLFERGDERYPVKDEPIPPMVPAALGGQLEVTPVSRSRDAARPDQRAFVIDDLLREARQKISAAKHDEERIAAKKSFEAIQAELALEAQESDGLSKESDAWKEAAKEVTALQREAEKLAADSAVAEARRSLTDADGRLEKAEASEDAAAIKGAKRAKAAAEKAVAAAETRLSKATEVLSGEVTTEFNRREQNTYPEKSSGRRLAFARWLTERRNPLTARVAVNHIWLRHFGRAIVPTVNDFGMGGREPTHPALLDWLAAEWMHRDWSMKQLHRLIVTSATYRMASTTDQVGQSVDPDNEYYWRGPIRRMEGEIVRDNLLSIAGRLDTTFGGPDIDNHLAQSSQRRSIYLRHAHEKLVEFVQIFDGPAVSECYVRETSVQPHQALALANSTLTVEAAKAISRELEERTSGDDTAFIREAFLRVLGRSAKDEEVKLCLDFLDDGIAPRRNLIMVLVNHNDFVSIR